jgi:uncharacterized membrane protein YadS
VNDTSSVVAVGYAYGHAAGAYAVVVKLTRTTLIVPIVFVLAALERRRGGSVEGVVRRRWTAYMPFFIVCFVLAAAANSAGLITPPLRPDISKLALFLISVALAAVGLSTQPAAIRAAGTRPLVLGGALWVLVASTSLAVQALTALR